MHQISIMKFRDASTAPRQSWLSIIARVLAKWVGRPRALRPPRWYESDGAHRGI
jgi:hypothetical protein